MSQELIMDELSLLPSSCLYNGDILRMTFYVHIKLLAFAVSVEIKEKQFHFNMIQYKALLNPTKLN